MNKKSILISGIYLVLIATVCAKSIGGSVGTRMSVLGFEPSVSLNISDFEIETACPLIRVDKAFGWAVSLSAGYLSHSARRRGWQRGVGLTYSYFSSAYCSSFISLFSTNFDSIEIDENGNVTQLLMTDSDYTGPLHLMTLYFKGQYKFSNGVAVFFRYNFPLIALFCSEGEYDVISLIDYGAPLVSIITAFYTPSIGVCYKF